MEFSGIAHSAGREVPLDTDSDILDAFLDLLEDVGVMRDGWQSQVAESVMALAGTMQVRRYRRHANSGCECVGC